MQKLTPKQAELLKYIENYQVEHGASPTIREMCKAMDVSSDNAIIKHLNGLQRKSYITRRMDIPRGVGLLAKARNRLEQPAGIKIPVLGSIPAGNPVLTEEHLQDSIALGEDVVFRPQDAFALRVTGDSMVDAGILDDDLVVACRTLQPKEGDIVVALVDGMNTVKRLKRHTIHGYFLKPENPAYEPIYPQGDLQIQGVVTSLIRTYRKREYRRS